MKQDKIIALAILKTNYEGAKDYVDSFVPMIGDCIRLLEKQTIGISEIQSKINDTYNLTIPEAAINTIMRRLQKKGYVVNKENNQYTIELKKFEKDFNISSKRDDNEREFNMLVKRLKKFSDEHEIFNKQDFSYQNLKEALLNYFDYQQSGEINNQSPIAVVAYFIEHINRSDPELFKYFEKIYLGHAITKAMYYYQDTNQIKANLSKLTVYFDTPLLLRALNYSYKQYCRPVTELITILKEKKVKLRYFKHNQHEVEDIMRVASNRMQEEIYLSHHSDSIRWLMENYSRADIYVKSEELEKDLSEKKISRGETLDFNSRTSLDEEKLKQKFKETFPSKTDHSIDNDIKSITSIFNIRKGIDCDNLPNCSAIFLIINTKMFSIISQEEAKKRAVPLCILLSDLTSFLWFSGYFKKTSNLPKQIIYADAYTLMEPNENFRRKFESEVKKIKKEGLPEHALEYFMNDKTFFKKIYEETGGSTEKLLGTELMEKKIREHFSKESGDLRNKVEKLETTINSKKNVEIEVDNLKEQINNFIKTKLDKYSQKIITKWQIIFYIVSVFLIVIVVLDYFFIEVLKKYIIWATSFLGISIASIFAALFSFKKRIMKSQWFKNKIEKKEEALKKEFQNG